MEEVSTQLADTKPILDKPLHVAIPVNVPARNSTANRDTTIYQTTFSPNAISQSYFQFYHNSYKEHNFYTQKPTTTTDSSVSMFTPEDSGKFINILEKIQLHKLPISQHDLNSSNSIIISQQFQNKHQELSSSNSLKYDANLKNLLNDYQLLSVSSKRANKKDVEAMAYASLGVLYDNQEDYYTAINYYQQYLQLCEELQDIIGISSAYNCIGLNYMLLVNPLMEKSDILKNYLFSLNERHSMDAIHELGETNQLTLSPSKLKSATNPNNNNNASLGLSINTANTLTSTMNSQLSRLKENKDENSNKSNNSIDANQEKYRLMVKRIHKAIQAHQKHLDICPDLGGKFIANINLGICYHWMNHLQQSAFHFQDALRIAIKMQTLFGQSIAVGNLGLLALYKKDYHTSRTCFEQVCWIYLIIFYSRYL